MVRRQEAGVVRTAHVGAGGKGVAEKLAAEGDDGSAQMKAVALADPTGVVLLAFDGGRRVDRHPTAVFEDRLAQRSPARAAQLREPCSAPRAPPARLTTLQANRGGHQFNSSSAPRGRSG